MCVCAAALLFQQNGVFVSRRQEARNGLAASIWPAILPLEGFVQLSDENMHMHVCNVYALAYGDQTPSAWTNPPDKEPTPRGSGETAIIVF